MFAVGDRDAAWHRLGQRTPNAVTWREAITLADLNWDVVKKQLWARNPLNNVVEVPMFATMRSDDGAYLGCVGEGYQIIQNRERFAWCDALIGVAEGAHYETAGALGNGERVWALARIPEGDYAIGKDEHKAYLLAMGSHDSSTSEVAKLVDTRVVCANTLAVALQEGGKAFRIRHTASAKAKMDAAVANMAGVMATARTVAQRMTKLAETQLKRESVEKILDRLFPKNGDASANQTRRDQTITTVLDLYAANDGGAFPETAGSAYNLFNAVTEFADHFRTARGKGSDPAQVSMARAESALFGSGEALKGLALEVISEVTDDYNAFLKQEGLA